MNKNNTVSLLLAAMLVENVSYAHDYDDRTLLDRIYWIHIDENKYILIR